MKILKHGNRFARNKIITCSVCDCKFEYDEDDIIKDKGLCFETFPPTLKTYVKCPECGSEIFLSTQSIRL